MSAHHLRVAARYLWAGGIVAYPTEAVFGVGCDPLDATAVARLMALKGRAGERGLIVIGACWEHLAPLLVPPVPELLARVRAEWPGPVTWILPAARGVPHWLTGGRTTLAVRVPGLALARDLCRAFGGPLVSTSANRSGHRPARSVLAVRRALGSGVDYVLPGMTGGAARPSTIKDGGSGAVLRV